MKLECLIRRKGGTTVTFDAKSRERLGLPPGSYHFKPETAAPDAPHVAEVANAAHIDHFLTIRSFRPFNGESLAAPSLPPLTKEPAKPDGGAFDAAAIQGKSVRDLREVVDTLTTEQVREVLQLEQEDPNPRSSVVELLLARIRKDEGQ